MTIPTTVTSIGTIAFWSCKKLKRIAIPPSVKEIGEKAFENSALDTVEVAPGDTDRVRALLAASGYDTSMVTFVESGDLSLLIGDTTFGDGAMLYGTLNGNYKISIADGATVTLLYANIVGVNGAFDAQAYIYFPPKSGKFAGCCECVSLRWNGTAFE